MSDRNPLPPALDPKDVEMRRGTNYPEEFRALCDGREKRALGNALGLRNFGVNLVRLLPGSASAQRHWHSKQDEFIYVLEGEIALVTDSGEQALGPGMVAGFPADAADGHHLVNRGDTDALYLEVGDRTKGDEVAYPDIDLAVRVVDGKGKFTRADGSPL